MMFISVDNLKCGVPADAKARYALNAFALYPEGVVTATGRYLMYVPYPKGITENGAETMPKIKGVDSAQAAPTDRPLLINRSDAAEAAKLVVKKSTNPACALIHVSYEDAPCGDPSEPRHVTFGTTDLSREKTVSVVEESGGYPDIASIIPDSENANLTVTFDVGLMLNLLTQIAKASTRDNQLITLRLRDEDTGMLLSTNDGIGAVLMPVDPDNNEKDALNGLKVKWAKAKEAKDVKLSDKITEVKIGKKVFKRTDKKAGKKFVKAKKKAKKKSKKK